MSFGWNSKVLFVVILLVCLAIGLGWAPATAVHAQSPCGPTYTVERGDVLILIARRCGTTVEALLEANPQVIENRNLIFPGEVLTIPGAEPVMPTRVPFIEMEQQLAIHPVVGPAGTPVQVIGSGLPQFQPFDIGIALPGEPFLPLEQVETSEFGAFQTIVTVPEGVAPGTDWSIVAQSEDQAIQVIAEMAQPVAGIFPQRGAVGDPINLIANGFPPNTEVIIGMGPPASDFTVVESAVSNANGSLNATLFVPDFARPDDTLVTVVQTRDGAVQAVSNPLFVTGAGAAAPVVASEAIPPEVAMNADQWPLPHQDYANTRNAQSASIDSSNIGQLGVAWTFDIPGSGPYGAAASAPLVIDNTVYFQDLASNVYALDLTTGEMIWENRVDTPAIGPNGPAVGYGLVYAQGSVNTLRALDLATGDEVWTTELSGPSGVQQPTVFGGRVFTGTAAGAVIEDREEGQVALRGYAPGTSGYMYGVDAMSGEIDWQFQTVEEGFWGHPEINSGGGVWYTPAIDTETGMTFWGTGNPAPFPGIVDWPNGTSRPGPNLYTSSILALDGATGDMAWFNQAKPHDLFDLDFQAPRILATATINGQMREIVIGSGKLGRVIAYDRATGDVLWDVEVGAHMNDQLQALPLDGTVVNVQPSVYGGVETPMAYGDGVVYVPILNAVTPYTATAFGATSGTEAVQAAEERTDLSTATGQLGAIDVNTGEILWSTPFDAPNFGAATVINDLIVTSTFDGTVYALSRADGSVVWTYQAPAGINAWPAVVGDTLLIPAGVGETPQLVALRLGAEAPADQRNVRAVDFRFEPRDITVRVGTRVDWTNNGGVAHTVTSDDTLFDSGTMNPGETFSFTFDEPGTYPYYCRFHGGPGGQGMAGTVTVVTSEQSAAEMTTAGEVSVPSSSVPSADTEPEVQEPAPPVETPEV